MPRIAGRIIGLLQVDERPFSFGELATELGVSRGSVSANTRLLLDRGIIEKVSRPGDRQDYFRMAANPNESPLQSVSRRMEKTASDILRITDRLPEDAEVMRGRMKRRAAFHAAMAKALRVAAEEVKASQDPAV